MKVGISTACFYPMETERAMEQAISLCFDEIEVFFNAESEFSPSYLKPLRQRLDAAGVRVKSVHPYTSALEGLLLFSDYRRRTQDALNQYDRYFAGGEILGARMMTFHGERDMPVTFHEESMEGVASVYHSLCARARDHGMVLAQENVGWCKSSRPEYLSRLAQAVPELRFTLDIKQAHRAGRQPEEYLQVMGRRLANVHMNDCTQQDSCLLPGEGDFDFESLFARLNTLGYDDSVLLEVYSTNYVKTQQLTRSRAFLTQLMERMNQPYTGDTTQRQAGNHMAEGR